MDEKVYAIHGRRFRSSVELPGVPTDDCHESDVDIVCGRVSGSEGLQDRGALDSSVRPELFFEFPNVARLLACNGRRIVVDQAPGAATHDVGVLLVGSVLPVVLLQRGMFAAHACAVRRGPYAVLFAGASGTGKSSLAAGLYSRGFEILADDRCVLAFGEPGHLPLAHPAAPVVNLWWDSARALSLTIDRLPPVRRQLLKFTLDVRDRFCAVPSPCARIYVLSARHTKRVEIEPVSSGERMNLLLRHMVVRTFLAATGRERDFFLHAARLARTVEVRRIARPHPLALDELVAHVEDDISR